MKLGLHLYDFSWPGGASQLGPTLVQIAQAAESAGFDRLTTIGHVWQSHYLGGAEHEVPSCYPTLIYLAAHTSRMKVLALATASPYWHPILLAKTVTTLDVLSGGRAWLGIGAGDYEEEARGVGAAFPSAQRALRAARRDASNLFAHSVPEARVAWTGNFLMAAGIPPMPQSAR